MFYEDFSSETFSDIETDSLAGLSDTENGYQDFSYSSLIKDTPFYSHSNNFKNQDSKSIFDTDDFPMDLIDIDEEITLENMKIETTGEIFNLTLPVINVKTEYRSDQESDDSGISERSYSNYEACSSSTYDSPVESPKSLVSQEITTRLRPARRREKRRHFSSDTDSDWSPEEEEPVRRKPSSTVRSRRSRTAARYSHKPVPQQRKTGTKKITQWILSLLRDPQYNPRVIYWDNEDKGIFYIADTSKYAKMWGERKKNPSMNYEKLSRAMRYYYKNGELRAVEKRTTYQFGEKSDYWKTIKD